MKTLLLLAALALTGCATQDYEAYANAQKAIAEANAASSKARYEALSKVAETGDASSKIAAVMALALGGGGGGQAPQVQQVQAPQPNQALQWAGILVPSLTTLASINANMRIGLANSDASARIAESTNSTFLGVAGKIQAPDVSTCAGIHGCNHTVTRCGIQGGARDVHRQGKVNGT